MVSNHTDLHLHVDAYDAYELVLPSCTNVGLKPTLSHTATTSNETQFAANCFDILLTREHIVETSYVRF